MDSHLAAAHLRGNHLNKRVDHDKKIIIYSQSPLGWLYIVQW